MCDSLFNASNRNIYCTVRYLRLSAGQELHDIWQLGIIQSLFDSHSLVRAQKLQNSCWSQQPFERQSKFVVFWQVAV